MNTFRIDRGVIVSKVLTILVFLLAGMQANFAVARGIAIDTEGENPLEDSCALGAACAPSQLGGQYDITDIVDNNLPDYLSFSTGIFNKVYVYDDGVISLGKPLPATASLAGGLKSLGSNYIAAGFSDLYGPEPTGAPQYGCCVVEAHPKLISEDLDTDSGVAVTSSVDIDWVFNTPNNQGAAILGLQLFELSPTKIDVHIDFGAYATTWFGMENGDQLEGGGVFNEYCDAICAGDDMFDGDQIYGVYLPLGALIGSGFGGLGKGIEVGPGFSYPGYSFTISIPEPNTWMMMILGFGVIGTLFRLRRNYVYIKYI